MGLVSLLAYLQTWSPALRSCPKGLASTLAHPQNVVSVGGARQGRGFKHSPQAPNFGMIMYKGTTMGKGFVTSPKREIAQQTSIYQYAAKGPQKGRQT